MHQLDSENDRIYIYNAYHHLPKLTPKSALTLIADNRWLSGRIWWKTSHLQCSSQWEMVEITEATVGHFLEYHQWPAACVNWCLTGKPTGFFAAFGIVLQTERQLLLPNLYFSCQFFAVPKKGTSWQWGGRKSSQNEFSEGITWPWLRNLSRNWSHYSLLPSGTFDLTPSADCPEEMWLQRCSNESCGQT